MAGGFLHFFQRRAVFKRGGDERRAHRMRRISPLQPNCLGMLPQHAVNRIGMHGPPCFLPFAVTAERPEQRPVQIVAVALPPPNSPDALRGLRMNGEGVAPAAFTLMRSES